MNKEILEDKIAKLLKVSDQEKNLAFKIFKEKLSENLKVGEALRVKDLGVFQLKEQLDHQSVGKSGEKPKNLTLVFSPQSDDSLTNSLFVNLEIDKSKNDDTEFNENLFQLGIGKPLVIDSNQELETGENILSDTDRIENEVSILFEKSEKLKDFDLWEDYLERKETTNILQDSDEDDLSIDSILDENVMDIPEVDLNQLDNEFISETEDENFNDMEEKNTLEDSDELEDLAVADGVDLEEIDISDNIEESLENVVQENEVEGKLNEIDLEHIGDEETNTKSIIEQIDEELAANEIPDKPIIEKQVYEDEINSISEEDKLSIPEDVVYEEMNEGLDENIEKEIDGQIDEEMAELNEKGDIEGVENIAEEEISDDVLQIDEVVEVERQPAGKKNKTLLWLLILAFIVIGAIGIYYLFFNTTPTTNNEIQTEILSGEENPIEVIDDDANEMLNNEKDEIEAENVEVIEPPISEENEINSNESKPEIDNTISADSENEIAKNIYFDGFVYNVQISSWKQEKIAQNEVNKLVKSGYPAYKVKVYIPKFDGYWHRVRIGPFTSMQEAEETLKKVNK
jgi:cell division septation protein DedD/nucleoid DNA-binding protein